MNISPDSQRVLGALGVLPGDLAQRLWARTGAGDLEHEVFGPGKVAGGLHSHAGMVLAGPLRLDNRAEIAAALGRDGAQAMALEGRARDAALIALAYRHWGVAGFARLAGDFALALWDARAETLLLLRDHMGVRPLYYRFGESYLAFASAADELRTRPVGMEQTDIAGFIAALPDYERPLRGPEGICRVMPGECVIWRAGTAPEPQRYWELGLQEIPCENAAEQFQALLDDAVRARLEDARAPAAMLSGGLDSSSVALLAARHRAPLPVYSGLHPERPAQDESHYIDKVLERGDFQPHQVNRDARPPLELLEQSLREQGGVFHAPGLPVSRDLYTQAAGDGIDVLLDGHGGDEVAWHGSSRMMELAAANHWLQVLRLLPTHCRLFGENPLTALLVVAQKSGHGRALPVRALNKASRVFSGQSSTRTPVWWRLIRRDVAEREDLAARWSRENILPEECRHSDRANQHRVLTAPLYAHAFEVFARTSAAAGLEVRYPFCDRRLVEFCLALPADEKFRPGETRSLLRRGLRDVLPPEIATRQDKIDFLPVIRDGLAGPHRSLLETMARDSTGMFGEWLDMEALRQTIGSFVQNPEQSDADLVLTLWRLASLHLWAGMTATDHETGPNQKTGPNHETGQPEETSSL